MSEQIIRIQLIYQLQRTTVTSGTAWPLALPCVLWISQGLLCRTAQQLVCLWAGHCFCFMQVLTGTLVLDISPAAELSWESAESSRITPWEHKWKIVGNQECNMLCGKRRHEQTASNSCISLFSFWLIAINANKLKTHFWHETKKMEKARQSGGKHRVTWGILAVPCIMKSPTTQVVPWTKNMMTVLYKETLQFQPTLSLGTVLGLTVMAVCNSPLQTEGNGLFLP